MNRGSTKPLLHRSIENYPDSKIVREIFEPMRDMRSGEKQIARTDSRYVVLHPVEAGPGGDNVEFIALMRDLWPI